MCVCARVCACVCARACVCVCVCMCVCVCSFNLLENPTLKISVWPQEEGSKHDLTSHICLFIKHLCRLCVIDACAFMCTLISSQIHGDPLFILSIFCIAFLLNIQLVYKYERVWVCPAWRRITEQIGHFGTYLNDSLRPAFTTHTK